MIFSSECNDFQPERSEATARNYITQCSKNSEEPYFVVLFGPDDLPQNAYADRRGQWRNLDMLKASPLPADLSKLNFHAGDKSIPPYVVTRW